MTINSEINLSIEIAGVKFNNPLLLSEGPPSGNTDLIEEASHHSVGAIITKSIRQNAAESPHPYMVSYRKGLLNADWNDIGFERWCQELRNLEIDVPLITNVATNHVPPKKAAEYAEILQQCGADIVTFSDYIPENLIEAVSYARDNVDVPIMVKLAPFIPNIEEICLGLEGAGVNCIAAMDAVGPGLDIDIETGEPVLGSPDGGGYLSGSPIFPLSLYYVSQICRYVDVPVIGVGGISDYRDVVKMIMAGATGVGMVTSVIINGYGVFDRIEKDLLAFMEQRNINSLKQIRGVMQKKLAHREENYRWKPEVIKKNCSGCGLCVKSCYQNIITIGGGVAVINTEDCTGCGICASRCPQDSIRFPHQ